MPDLSIYYQRPVTSVDTAADDPSEWAIRLEGGIGIVNFDGRRTSAPSQGIIGFGLRNAVVDEEAGTTTLDFGSEQVVLSTNNFALTVPKPEPEIPTAEEALPPDPSAERVVDGPTTEEVE